MHGRISWASGNPLLMMNRYRNTSVITLTITRFRRHIPVCRGVVSHGETYFQDNKKGRFHDLHGTWKRPFSAGRGGCLNGGGSCQHHPDIFWGETKRLDLRRNQAFHNASGGDKRDRTADLLNAIQALSQLSYTPVGDALLLNYKGFCFK